MSFIYINTDIGNFDNFSSSTFVLSAYNHKTMLGFLYLILILGWVLIIVIIKCKKSITPHLTLSSNLQNVDRRPSVHVIQLDEDNNYRETLNHHHQSIIDEPITQNYPIDAVVNPGYNHDEEYIINAPPPSYEEVMRQPEIYPKVREIKGAT